MSQSRQLAAIMFTDIVGYTALMGKDEQHAFSTLKENRNIHKPVIEQFHGKLIKELGDGNLAIFKTATDAVMAAKSIQEKCTNAGKFKLRIGIHSGDIVVENDDVFGDGVNVASRIQTEAEPGSIFISESVFHNVLNKKDIQTRFVKEASLKHVRNPVRIYEVLADGNHEDVHEHTAPGEVKSIAVLPFMNMSNDTEQDYFCDGISEEIINTLSQLNNLRVLSRTSSFALAGKNLDAKKIGQELNVTSLLEGSVRKSGQRLRIVTKLVNVTDGTNMWTDKYDRDLDDVFAIQEDIAMNVATALKGVLTLKEREDIRRPETNVEAYEYFLKGRELFRKLYLPESIVSFKKAIDIDDGYAPAYAGLADSYSWLCEWEGGTGEDLAHAKEYSAMALRLAPDLSESHLSRAFVLSLAKDFGEAEKEFENAISLNPNSFDAYYLYARACFANGRIEKSAELFLKASEVRPEDFQSLLLLSQSLHKLGKDFHATELEGVNRARRQIQLDPEDRRALSLVSQNLCSLGYVEEGRRWIGKAIALYPDDASVLINGTCFYAKLGEKDAALDLLTRAVDKGFGKRDWIEQDPDYDSLRDDPRFTALMSRLK